MPGRTWVIAPDAESLERRWKALRDARTEQKATLFHPHLRRGKPGDRHVNRAFERGLPGHAHRAIPVAKDTADVVPPVRYAFRSFDRQWLIPDYRLINQPNPTLWETYSPKQMFLTAPSDRSPSNGPALTFCELISDLHHYNGRGGRTYPLWADAKGEAGNVSRALIQLLTEKLGAPIGDEDIFAYIAAVAAHPAYTSRFQRDLIPGLRIPLTADPNLFRKAVEVGRRVIWLHTYGERLSKPGANRPPGPPRLAKSDAPIYPHAGAIPSTPDDMPDRIDYDPAARRLRVGKGFIENVPAEV